MDAIKQVLERMTKERQELQELLATAQPWAHVITSGDTVNYVTVLEGGAAGVGWDLRKAFVTARVNAERIARKFHTQANGKPVYWQIMTLEDAIKLELIGLEKVINLLTPKGTAEALISQALRA